MESICKMLNDLQLTVVYINETYLAIFALCGQGLKDTVWKL